VKLIVGLGNPGRLYRWTRHNVGFLLVDRLAEKHSIELAKRGLKSIYGRGKIGKEGVVLAKPQTFMNLSGEAVGGLIRFFKIPPEDLVVLQDDLDLPTGKIRIRLRGGHGGHKGIQSIVETLGVDSFVRFKVGIGRPDQAGQDPADYVLEPLEGGERERFKEMISRNAEALELLIREGSQEAMNRFHKDRELRVERCEL
jgi:PTH1 family peptidyl-tRNA hydrolase